VEKEKNRIVILDGMLGCEEKHVAGGRIGGSGKGEDGRAFCAPFARVGVLCVSFVRQRENACRDREH
jgi:hypothetical protein